MNDPASSATPTDTRTMPLEDRVARQAHALWEGYGQPSGRDVAIWLEAERQVLGVDARVNGQAGGAVAAPGLNAALTPRDPAASTPDGNRVTQSNSRPTQRTRAGDSPKQNEP